MNYDINKNAGAVVIDSSKERNDKLKEKWSKVNEISSTLTSVSSSGFIVSLLSPFDFDGPVVEIVTAVVASVGFILKKISQSKLEGLGEGKNQVLDEDDKNILLTVAKNFGYVVNEKNNGKKTR